MTNLDPFESNEAPGLLLWLQGWYTSMCDGDWEHSFGVKIENLDNPGWSVEIDLTGTGLAGQAFTRREVQRDKHDWLHVWVESNQFKAFCGPTNLSEALWVFREWTATSSGPRGWVTPEVHT